MVSNFLQRFPISGLLPISRRLLLSISIFGLFGLVFYIHLIYNEKNYVNSFADVSSSSSLSPITDGETKEYRQHFNLLIDGSPGEIGKDCTLGSVFSLSLI